MSEALQVAPPSLVYTQVAGACAALEEPVQIRLAPVRYADGSVLDAADVRGAYAQLARFATGTSPPDIWDPVTKTWKAASSVDPAQVHGVPLMPSQSASDEWEGMLIGVGAKDAAGAPLITPAVAQFPQYRLRAVFHAERNGVDAFGIGVESAPLLFLSTVELKRFGVELSPDQTEATHVRIMLVDAAKRARGAIEIDASGNGVLTLANFDGAGGALASITLESNGTIRLAPASGAKVVIAGDLETDRIRYLPSGGGFHQNLP